MPHGKMLVVFVALLAWAGIALSAPLITVKSVGFNGFYRQNTLVPVSVLIQNSGESMTGELRLSAPWANTYSESDQYRFPLTIPAGAKQLRTLYVDAKGYAQKWTVEFWYKGRLMTSSTYDQCQMLNPTDRLLVVVGGSGSSLNYINGQSITDIAESPVPQSWDVFSYPQWREMKANRTSRRSARSHHARAGSPPGGPSPAPGVMGTVRVTYLDSTLLPDNPEAYGSISMLALMADVSEETLKTAQDAITCWVATGGHLLVAGGGVTARLQAPFFAGLLPEQQGNPLPGATTSTDPDGNTIVTQAMNCGQVTLLHFDPDATGVRDRKSSGDFYANLIAGEPRPALFLALSSDLPQAVIVRNLHPINLNMILLFLLAYIICLVPVNYFILKKCDRREWAWFTTLGIVVIFTAGAYGIGAFSKGYRLVVNAVSVVETSAHQKVATANSRVLIFSPARRSYRFDLGDSGVFVREAEYGDQRYNSDTSSNRPLNYLLDSGAISLEKLQLNMWDMREFLTVHQLAMGKGFSANLKIDPTAKRAFGTVSNGTPYNYPICYLYHDGNQMGAFPLEPGQTITVEKTTASTSTGFTDDERNMLDSIGGNVGISRNHGSISDNKGFMLVCCTNDPRAKIPIKVNSHTPSTAITVVAVHL